MASHEHTERKERLSARERLQGARKYEGELQQYVHNKGKEKSRSLELPSSLIKAFMLTKLFQIETAVASEMHNEVNIGEIPFAEQVHADVELPQETRDALARYAAQDAIFTLTVQTREGEIVTGSVSPEAFLGDHPRVIEGTVVQVSIASHVTSEEFSVIRNAIADTSNLAPDPLSQKDRIFFQYGDQEASLTGYTTIFPIQNNATDDKKYLRIDAMNDTGNMHRTNISEPVAFGFSFDFIQESEVRELFYHDSLPSHGDIQGIPVSYSGIEKLRGEKILLEYQGEIEQGMATVQGYFGPDILKNNVKNIVFIDHNQQNAFARWDGILIEEDLIVGIESGELSRENLRETVEHELYHQIDFRYDFSQALETLFLTTDTTVLKELNESSFSGGIEGHAEDGPKELFASVMNSLDDPNWEQAVQKLSPEAKSAYVATLTQILSKVQARDLEFSSGSLLRELPKRIAFIESLSTR